MNLQTSNIMSNALKMCYFSNKASAELDACISIRCMFDRFITYHIRVGLFSDLVRVRNDLACFMHIGLRLYALLCSNDEDF